MAKKMSVGVKVAWIAFTGTILAAIIGATALLHKATPTHQAVGLDGNKIYNSGVIGNGNTTRFDNSRTYNQTNGGYIGTQINGDVGSLTIFNPPDTESPKLLAKLDERTSDIEKLPDGRTRFGGMVTGEPQVIVNAMSNAHAQFNKSNYSAALAQTEKAIEAVNASVRTNVFQQEKFITPYGIGAIYLLAARSATKLTNNTLATEFAQKAVKADANDTNKLFLALSLSNLAWDKVQNDMSSNAWVRSFHLHNQAITNFESIKSETTNLWDIWGRVRLYGGGSVAAHFTGDGELELNYQMKSTLLVHEYNRLQKTNVTK